MGDNGTASGQSREQRAGLLLPRKPTPGPASRGQAKLDLCIFMGSHLLGGLPDFWWCSPLCDLPLACNPNMLPFPQIPTLGHVAGAGLPIMGLGVDS